jgi:hypothetical protein
MKEEGMEGEIKKSNIACKRVKRRIMARMVRSIRVRYDIFLRLGENINRCGGGGGHILDLNVDP